MKNLMAAMLLTAAVSGAACAEPGAAKNAITGDYVEARTASVFAGACHYNGEVTTTGREAEMVWHIQRGVWNGVTLDGLSAMAAIASDANLSDTKAVRHAVLFIDANATDAQADALTAALKAKNSGAFGDLVDVKRAAITFRREGENFRITAQGVGRLSVDAMPNRECCKQPNMVWYNPLIALQDRRVGFTVASGIQDKTLGVNWSRSEENSAFYGTFAL